MRKLETWGVRLAGALAITLLSAGAIAQTDGGKFKPTIDSTVRVLALMPDGKSNYGTGWVIQAADKQNRAGAAVIVTARHVVEGASKVTIVEPGSAIDVQRVGTVISSTPERDLAFLEVKDISEPALTLTRTIPNVGDSVRAIGYASASDANETNGRATRGSLKFGGLSKTFRGPISGQAQAPIDQIEYDAPILAGFSGGPVVNDCGRVIGITVKDGGHIRLREGAEIAVAQGVSVAVSSNEVVKAARDANINLQVADSACGDAAGSTAPPPPPPPQCSKPFISSEQGHVCLPKQPTQLETFTHWLTTKTGIVSMIAVLGLLIVLGAIAAILRGRKPVESATITESSVLKSAPLTAQSKLLENAKTIRLTGRGSAGEPIDLRLDSNELAGSGVMLGVEGDQGGHIPDSRPNKHVSRKHAILSFDGRSFMIVDNKSANGTFIGDDRLTPGVPRALVSGDRLRLADVALNVTIN